MSVMGANHLFEELETGAGLDIVIGLQSMSHPLLDALAGAMHVAGSDIFVVVLLLFIYWNLNRSLGARLIWALIVAGVVAYVLKETFQRPRPFMVSDIVIPLFSLGSYGIPSGHVMTTLVVWGYLAVYLGRRWLYGLVFLYVGVVAWSRMYAGVHYPQDVVLGVLGGLVALWALVSAFERFGGWWLTLNTALRVGIVMITGVLLAVILQEDADGLAVAGFLIGAGPALALERRTVRFRVDGTPRQHILRYVVGVVLALAILLGLRALTPDETVIVRLGRYAITGLFIFWLWPWLAVKIGWMQSALVEPLD